MRSVLLVVLLTLVPMLVAGKCKGEASFAIAECACTVHNRLQAGWRAEKVLDHYYAPFVRPTAQETALVGSILAGEQACDPGLYFMYSRADTMALGIEDYEPSLVVREGNKEVRFFERWFR